jgi:hypothetical protein
VTCRAATGTPDADDAADRAVRLRPARDALRLVSQRVEHKTLGTPMPAADFADIRFGAPESDAHEGNVDEKIAHYEEMIMEAHTDAAVSYFLGRIRELRGHAGAR